MLGVNLLNPDCLHCGLDLFHFDYFRFINNVSATPNGSARNAGRSNFALAIARQFYYHGQWRGTIYSSRLLGESVMLSCDETPDGRGFLHHLAKMWQEQLIKFTFCKRIEYTCRMNTHVGCKHLLRMLSYSASV